MTKMDGPARGGVHRAREMSSSREAMSSPAMGSSDGSTASDWRRQPGQRRAICPPERSSCRARPGRVRIPPGSCATIRSPSHGSAPFLERPAPLPCAGRDRQRRECQNTRRDAGLGARHWFRATSPARRSIGPAGHVSRDQQTGEDCASVVLPDPLSQVIILPAVAEIRLTPRQDGEASPTVSRVMGMCTTRSPTGAPYSWSGFHPRFALSLADEPWSPRVLLASRSLPEFASSGVTRRAFTATASSMEEPARRREEYALHR